MTIKVPCPDRPHFYLFGRGDQSMNDLVGVLIFGVPFVLLGAAGSYLLWRNTRWWGHHQSYRQILVTA
jgi:hypothetical protein